MRKLQACRSAPSLPLAVLAAVPAEARAHERSQRWLRPPASARSAQACSSPIRVPSMESVAYEQPPEPPERGPGLWKRSDGRHESRVDEHDANEIDTYADSQNRESSTCCPDRSHETADGDKQAESCQPEPPNCQSPVCATAQAGRAVLIGMAVT